jgi:hypothetical protein
MMTWALSLVDNVDSTSWPCPSVSCSIATFAASPSHGVTTCVTTVHAHPVSESELLSIQFVGLLVTRAPVVAPHLAIVSGQWAHRRPSQVLVTPQKARGLQQALTAYLDFFIPVTFATLFFAPE